MNEKLSDGAPPHFLNAINFADEIAARDAEHREYSRNVLLSLIELMDSFERFLAITGSVERPSGEDALAWRQSVRVIAKQLQNSMNAAGLVSLNCMGKVVDPKVHEVIETRPARGQETGTIIEVASQGYTWEGILIRRPQVVAIRESEDSR